MEFASGAALAAALCVPPLFFYWTDSEAFSSAFCVTSVYEELTHESFFSFCNMLAESVAFCCLLSVDCWHAFRRPLSHCLLNSSIRVCPFPNNHLPTRQCERSSSLRRDLRKAFCCFFAYHSRCRIMNLLKALPFFVDLAFFSLWTLIFVERNVGSSLVSFSRCSSVCVLSILATFW